MTDLSITNATVRFMRRIQPAEYQPAEAEVTLSAVVPEGGSITQAQTDALILQAKGTVNAALGIAPKTAEAKTSNVTKPTVVEPKPAVVAPVKPAAPAAEAPKKGPGRPAGSTKKVEPAKAAPAPAADEFGEVEAPAETEAPAEADEFGETEVAAVQPVTLGELQGEVTALIKAKKITVDAVKGVYGEYGQARSADLQPDQYGPALAKIKALAKA